MTTYAHETTPQRQEDSVQRKRGTNRRSHWLRSCHAPRKRNLRMWKTRISKSMQPNTQTDSSRSGATQQLRKQRSARRLSTRLSCMESEAGPAEEGHRRETSHTRQCRKQQIRGKRFHTDTRYGKRSSKEKALLKIEQKKS